MHTEEQAKELECRVGGPDFWEKDGDGGRRAWFPKCIASACAHWRWAEEEREERRIYLDDAAGYTRSDGTSAVLNDERWIYSHTDADERGRFDLIHRRKSAAMPIGFCGLAGKP